jgi:uncharacterized protein (TIGR02118 family)
MVKLSVFYMQPEDPQAFEERYNFNLSLMERLPGIQRRQACVVLGGPGGKSPYYRILELYFEDFATLDAAMLSPQGREAGTDLMAFAADRVQLVFSEVFED